ncbi:MAG TPA: PKD domain-containing protein [Candidatus Bathyarchaeia archaeon]|nr:PKD domain-containing protein [Candidatus Bathyarchaeia archaeon]
MPQAKATRYAVLLFLSILGIYMYVEVSPLAYAAGPTTYTLTPLPFVTQEGYTITLILSVSGALPSTLYQFNFSVRDPSTKVWVSHVQNYTTFSTQTQFGLVVQYPSPSFIGNGRSSLVGQYVAWVDEIRPLVASNPVAVTPNGFYFILTDFTEYQRTQTVGIRASGYNASETATIIIRTQTSSTVVLNATATASSAGLIIGSWKIPRTAVLDNYLITVTGKSTAKNPADAHYFLVHAASMSVPTFTASKASYQRTETMKFSFTARYPDLQYANSGTALVTLTSPGGNSVSLTAVYDSVTATFDAIYKTFTDNQTGTWTASLGTNGFDDGFGNTGPSATLTASPQLQPATLAVTIISKSYFAISEQIKFNATIQYPDFTILTNQIGQAHAFLLFSGGGHNDTISQLVFDSTLNLWVGTYAPGIEPGGLWSLTVAGADSASPANMGKATKTIQLQDRIPFSTFTFTSGTILTSVPVSFDGTSSYDLDGTIVGYAWDFGDGSTGSGATPTHGYSIAGTYSVKLNVTDNSGSTQVSTQTVTITDRPPVVSLTLSSTTATPGQAVILTISASDPDGTIASTTVNWGDGTTDTISGPPTTDSHTYSLASGTSSKTYTISVTAHDNSGSTFSATSNPISVQTVQPSSNVSFPLYYFGILAALIATLLIGVFLAFRRHKVTHARLKIDLEAVKAEAGRIENQEFFQSVKDQLKKDKE